MSATRRKASRRRAPSGGRAFALTMGPLPLGGHRGLLLRLIALEALEYVFAALQLGLSKNGHGALAREFAPIGRELRALMREAKSRA